MAAQKIKSKKTAEKPIKKTIKQSVAEVKSDTTEKPKLVINNYFKNPVVQVVAKTLLTIAALFLTLIAVDYFVQYLNNDASMAIINNVRISEKDYYKKLDAYFNKRMSEIMIQFKLLDLEAKKNNITVTEDEINDAIAKTEEAAGGKEALAQFLESYSISDEEFQDRTKYDILLKKLLKLQLSYTEDDLVSYFNENKETLFPDNADAKYEDVKDEVVAAYESDQMSQLSYTYMSDLMTQYTVQNNKTDKPEYQFLLQTRTALSNVWKLITGSK